MEHSSKVPVTIADLEALPKMLKGEILDGRLYTRCWPDGSHACLKGCIAADIFRPFQRAQDGPGGWWIVVEPGIRLQRAVEVAPDIVGWRRRRMPHVPMGHFTVVPDWICEVVSPDTRRFDHAVKRRFYAEIGVQHLWYVDTEDRTLTVSRLHEGHWLELGIYSDSDRVRAEPFEAVEIDLAEWWPAPEPEPAP